MVADPSTAWAGGYPVEAQALFARATSLPGCTLPKARKSQKPAAFAPVTEVKVTRRNLTPFVWNTSSLTLAEVESAVLVATVAQVASSTDASIRYAYVAGGAGHTILVPERSK